MLAFDPLINSIKLIIYSKIFSRYNGSVSSEFFFSFRITNTSNNQDCHVLFACNELTLNYHASIHCVWALIQIGEKLQPHSELMDTQYETFSFHCY
jgi:hypothetical protein